MIDFAALALGPGIDAFARPISVCPVRSQPGKPAYPARGVWSSRNLDVATEDNRLLNSRTLTLGIRLSEFAIPPKTRDIIDVPAYLSLPTENTLWIDDIDLDGQGGATLFLKRGVPPKSGATGS
ncbi:hypothetical protein MKK75_02870 [Methylobacterium sp. J-030]|uniref:head-tail joining protein n=1 Tax=Methylobacterium sp. J-030 TaxID=2836627 RepID=UPI001FBB1003|nr:hypothetical protein [Methylobacterium sp. J-030]MCJ2067757.1 hypothetical protein [Methylobacterium sp. J-030]